MAVLEHLIAHTRGGDRTLTQPDRAAWLWRRLRERVPEARACCLMPNHVHLAAPEGRGEGFASALHGFSVKYRVRFDRGPIERATSHDIQFRLVRYVFFNPVRANLVADPYLWPWSTLRDVAGATAPTWAGAAVLARQLKRRAPGLESALITLPEHEVTPRRGPAPTLQVASLPTIRAAVASALRLPDTRLHTARARRAAVQAAFSVGSPNREVLAEHLGCTVRTILRDRKSVCEELDAVLTCLADPRLLRFDAKCPIFGTPPPEPRESGGKMSENRTPVAGRAAQWLPWWRRRAG